MGSGCGKRRIGVPGGGCKFGSNGLHLYAQLSKKWVDRAIDGLSFSSRSDNHCVGTTAEQDCPSFTGQFTNWQVGLLG